MCPCVFLLKGLLIFLLQCCAHITHIYLVPSLTLVLSTFLLVEFLRTDHGKFVKHHADAELVCRNEIRSLLQGDN